MQGLHLTADLHHCQCDSAWLTDATCLQAVQAVDLQAVGQLFHTFAPVASTPPGVTTTVLLAESHLCVCTRPELNAVTLDVYVCNFGGNHSAKAQALMDALLQLFLPQDVVRNRIARDEIASGAAV